MCRTRKSAANYQVVAKGRIGKASLKGGEDPQDDAEEEEEEENEEEGEEEDDKAGQIADYVERDEKEPEGNDHCCPVN